jgi:hypothetical protein
MKRPWLIAMVVTIALTTVFKLVFRQHGHIESWWHVAPAFDFFYGLVGCVGIVLVSKWLGYTWLQRHEDYYGDDAL